MFEFIRKNNKLLTGLLMLLVIPSFILGGLELYQRAVGPGNGVAVVDGKAITQKDWDAVHRERVQQLRASQPGMDDSLLESDFAKYQTLERMVNDYMLAAWVHKHQLYVPDQRVQEALLQIPQVAALRGADGKIDTKAYADLLRQNGKTPEAFEAMIRAQLSEQRLMQVVGVATGWQPAVLTEQAIKPLLTQREVQVALFPAADYAAKVQPDEAQLQTWYGQQAARYSVPEQAGIEYLVLDAAAVQKRHPYTEKELQEWFASQGARYGQPETRRASHILIAADEKADAATRAAARKKAEDLLKDIKAKPERFAELAKQHSQDPGSAAKGGDLGFFSRETMVKPFADAAFALKPGGISEVVQSRFGYHIIRLDAVKPAAVASLQAIRKQVENDFRQERQKQDFSNDARLLAEEVAKDRRSLKAAAEKLGLPVQTAQGLTPPPAPRMQGVLAEPAVLRAVFSPQALEGKLASDPIPVGNGQLVVAVRVTAHAAAHTKPYETVKAQVKADYVQAKAAELAVEAGKAQLQQWTQNPASASFAAPQVISRIKPGQYPRAVVDAALRADVAKLPALEGADLGSRGYAIVRIGKVVEASDSEAAGLRAQLAPAVMQGAEQAQMQAYLNSLRQTLKVKINVPKPALPAELALAAP